MPRAILGRVYLVGAGPGDPGLITVRGLELLRKAKVVIYDRLVSPVLLDQASPDAIRIFVGKSTGFHTLPQEQVNYILIDYARCGHCVVRLKGGDPFIFGRGAEEAEALAEAGIPFEIVPGVSSAVAVPA
ncbi:MAG: uroporphyrinogen-III C-methyltransferase, partial [Candidatus Binatia bacterium]